MASEPLSEPTRRMRRALLGASAGALAYAWFDPTITKFSIGTIEASTVQEALPWLLGIAVLWFGANYWSYFRDDMWGVPRARVSAKLQKEIEATRTNLIDSIGDILEKLDELVWDGHEEVRHMRTVEKTSRSPNRENYEATSESLLAYFEGLPRPSDHTDAAEVYDRVLDEIRDSIYKFREDMESHAYGAIVRGYWMAPAWRVHVIDKILPFSVAALALVSLVFNDPPPRPVQQDRTPSIGAMLDCLIKELEGPARNKPSTPVVTPPPIGDDKTSYTREIQEGLDRLIEGIQSK